MVALAKHTVRTMPTQPESSRVVCLCCKLLWQRRRCV